MNETKHQGGADGEKPRGRVAQHVFFARPPGSGGGRGLDRVMGRQIKVLHVDDEPDIRLIAQIALQTVGGFDLRQCDNGADALKLVSGFAPDIILLDMMMPVMNGEATFHALRGIDDAKAIPVVFMTAKAHRDTIDALLDNGAAAVITKPFDPMTLAATVEDILAGTRNPGAEHTHR